MYGINKIDDGIEEAVSSNEERDIDLQSQLVIEDVLLAFGKYFHEDYIHGINSK